MNATFLKILSFGLLSALLLRAGAETPGLRIGWAQTDITPEKTVLIAGQFHARVSEGIMDPITATALVLEAPGSGTRLALVSCDLISIQDGLRDAVRARLGETLPDLPSEALVMFSTHTHAAPLITTAPRYRPDLPQEPERHPYGIELAAMDPLDYVNWAAGRIAEAVRQAWAQRAAGGIAFGLGQAVVGHNRLIASASGSWQNTRSQMYGNPNHRYFSHVEGYEDHALHVLSTHDDGGRLTGLVLNLACPSQVSEGSYRISADFWHDVREELRRRKGADLFVLPQHSAAGDQSPRVLIHRAAEARMQRLAGRSRREEIAVRIADGVEAVLPAIEKEIAFDPVLRHTVQHLELPRRLLSESDRERAEAEAARAREAYETLRDALTAEPERPRTGRWYTEISRAYRLMRRPERVLQRFEIQQEHPTFEIEVHAIRLGDAAFVTNPFELYLDYGHRIQARSRAVQTFVVQLAGPGSYLPTDRSIAGGAYGAVPASTDTGPEGGRRLVSWSVDAIDALWDAD